MGYMTLMPVNSAILYEYTYNEDNLLIVSGTRTFMDETGK